MSDKKEYIKRLQHIAEGNAVIGNELEHINKKLDGLAKKESDQGSYTAYIIVAMFILLFFHTLFIMSMLNTQDDMAKLYVEYIVDDAEINAKHLAIDIERVIEQIEHDRRMRK